MRWSEIPTNPSTPVLRQFAAGVILITGGAACWQELVREDRTAAMLIAAFGTTLGLTGLAYPAMLRPLFVGWMIVAFPVAWAATYATLAFLFFAVFTPLSLVFRMCGRDALRLRFRNQKSYWERKPAVADVHAYFRQS